MFSRLFLILLLLFGCAKKEPLPNKKLTLAMHSTPATLDPGKSGDFLSCTMICLLYEGLMRSLPGKGVEYGIADDVQMSVDGLTYTFHLRDAYWSDGKEVTAFDFERSWKRIVDPNFPSLCSYLLFPILNGEKCVQGNLSPDHLGVKAIDNKTFVVKLEKRAPYFLSLTAFPLFLPIHSEKEDVTNGPFKLKSYLPEEKIVLEKNEGFWNKKIIPLDLIELQIIHHENTALELFEKGEIDWLGGPFSPLPLDAIDALETNKRLELIPMCASTFITFNTEKEPFNNPLFRKLLANAIDREEIAKQLKMDVALRPIPPAISPAPHKRTENPVMNFEWEHPSQTITLLYKGNSGEKRVAQALQRIWFEKLGISIQIEQVEAKLHMERLYKRDYEIALASWISQFDDPINLLDRFRYKLNPKNFPSWESETYQQFLELAANAATDEERNNYLSSAEDLLLVEVPIFPLYHWSSWTLSQPHVITGGSTPSGGILFERFDIDKTFSSD